MGQKDPLVEWQREGFEMFGQMMHGIWQDFIKYVMHVQVQVTRRPAAAGPVDADGRPTDAAAPAVAPAPEDAPVDDEGAFQDDPSLRNVQYSAPEDPSSAGSSARMAAAATAATAGGASAGTAPGPAGRGGAEGNGNGRAAPVSNTPLVKSDWDKTPRNAPCPCGSGKKFKMCHGKA
jgi:preprotein translocase subunit SecA